MNRVDPDGRDDFSIQVSVIDMMASSVVISMPFLQGDLYLRYLALSNPFVMGTHLLPSMPPSGRSGGGPVFNEQATRQNASNAIARALVALALPDCSKVFGYDVFSGTGAANPADILNSIAANKTGMSSNNLFQLQVGPAGYEQMSNGQFIPLNARTDAGTLSNDPQNPITYAIMTLNSDTSTLFNNPNTSVNDQTVTILHELAHAFDIVYGAGTSQIYNDNNNGLVSAQNSEYIKAQCGL